MGRLLLLLLVVTAFTAGCSRSDREADIRTPAGTGGNGAAAEPASNEPSRPRVVFLGDSLTAGYGLSKEQAVPSLIQKRLDAEGYNYEVVNHGVSGDTSAGGVSRLEWALTGDVRILVLELGANDGLRGIPVETTKANLEAIIKGAQSRGVRVLLTGMEAPPNHGPVYTAEFRAVFRDLADTYTVAFLPFYLDGVAGNPALNIADGIHPNAEGSVIIERSVWRSLQPLLDARLKTGTATPAQ